MRTSEFSEMKRSCSGEKCGSMNLARQNSQWSCSQSSLHALYCLRIRVAPSRYSSCPCSLQSSSWPTKRLLWWAAVDSNHLPPRCSASSDRLTRAKRQRNDGSYQASRSRRRHPVADLGDLTYVATAWERIS